MLKLKHGPVLHGKALWSPLPSLLWLSNMGGRRDIAVHLLLHGIQELRCIIMSDEEREETMPLLTEVGDFGPNSNYMSLVTNAEDVYM